MEQQENTIVVTPKNTAKNTLIGALSLSVFMALGYKGLEAINIMSTNLGCELHKGPRRRGNGIGEFCAVVNATKSAVNNINPK